MDHSTRRFQKSVQVPNYDERQKECFKDDSLHDFVIGLRNILHHIHMVQPGWHIRRRFDNKSHEARLKLDKDELSVVVQREKGKMNQAGSLTVEGIRLLESSRTPRTKKTPTKKKTATTRRRRKNAR